MKKYYLLLAFLPALQAAGAEGPRVRIGFVSHPMNPVLLEVVSKTLMNTGEFSSVQRVEFPTATLARASVKAGKTPLFVDPGTPVKDRITIVTAKNFPAKFPQSAQALQTLEQNLTDGVMDHLASLIKQEKKSVSEAAEIFIGSLTWKRLEEDRPTAAKTAPPRAAGRAVSFSPRFLKLVREHLFLTFVPLLLGLAAGVPLGWALAKLPAAKYIMESFTDVFVSIPPLALLCFFIPYFGVGLPPAMAALLLYNLLAVIRETRNAPAGGPLGKSHRLIFSPLFLSKMKTLAVTDVGIATLAAFLGAGGFGSLIVTGLAINDIGLALRGAMPAALLAIFVKWSFEGFEWLAVEKRKKNVSGK